MWNRGPTGDPHSAPSPPGCTAVCMACSARQLRGEAIALRRRKSPVSGPQSQSSCSSQKRRDFWPHLLRMAGALALGQGVSSGSPSCLSHGRLWVLRPPGTLDRAQTVLSAGDFSDLRKFLAKKPGLGPCASGGCTGSPAAKV